MRHHKDLITIVMEEAKKYTPKIKESATQALLIEFWLETYEKLKNKGLLCKTN